MPYQLDRDELHRTIDLIVDYTYELPVPEEIADLALLAGPEAVGATYAAWLMVNLAAGVQAGILERVDHFIIPV